MKACPFCGQSDPVLYPKGAMKYCYCGGCGADGPPDLGWSGAEEMWNTRPIEDVQSKALDIAARWYLVEMNFDWKVPKEVPEKDVEDLVNTWLYEANRE
jgi:hypothetical protein